MAFRPSTIFALYLIAAALGLTAAIIDYIRRGEINVAMIAAAIFLTAFGFAMKSRMK